MPAKDGHQPCLASSCHVEDFLATGPTTQKRDPARFAKAVSFCAGCHPAQPGGGPPSPFSKPRAVLALADVSEHGLQMNHWDHVSRTTCRDCHTVDATSFAFVAKAPGHAECSQCHGSKAGAVAMSQCDACHGKQDAARLAKSKQRSDVRSCSEQGTAGKAAEGPCFTHERKEHRFLPNGSPLQCNACHFMIDDKAKWGKFSYASVADIHNAPIIHNQRDAAHQHCGTSGCHKSDVDDSRGHGRCKLCHSSKVMESIFE